MVVINKTGSAQTAGLTIANQPVAGLAAVYRYSPANLNAIQRPADQPVVSGGFSASFPARSITLFVLPPAGSLAPTEGPHEGLYLPLVH